MAGKLQLGTQTTHVNGNDYGLDYWAKLIVGVSAGGLFVPFLVAADGTLATNATPALPSTTATGTTKIRNITLNSTAAVVKASPGNMFAWNIVNLTASAIYVKFYNKAAASVNPASDVPVFTVQVPASSTYTLRGSDLPISFATAISMRCVTDAGDTGTSAPSTSPIVELEIK